MTTYTGTFGADNFAGLDDVKDVFKFDGTTLASYDIANGGGGSTLDIVQLTAGGSFTKFQFDHITGMEQIKLAAGTTLELWGAMFDTARNNQIEVFGSADNDTIYGDDAAQTTAQLVFDPGAGNDTFLGTAGDDTIQIAAADWNSRDFFSGGVSGIDTVELTTSGFVDAGSTLNLHGFDKLVLNAGGNSMTLRAAAVGSSETGAFRVIGSANSDTILANDSIGNIVFTGNGGTDMFIAGAGDDVANGGAGNDIFNGGAGDDALNGIGGFDHLYGGDGKDTLKLGNGTGQAFGGVGADRIFSGASGHVFIWGDGDSDLITLHSSDGGNTDVLVYTLETDGGKKGDKIVGDGGTLATSDLYFQFDQRAGQFDTFGTLDKIVNANGSEAGGAGNPVDGADLVLYNGNVVGGTVLGSATAVDNYLFAHYYASQTSGVFLAEQNANGTITLYYDTNGYGHSTVDIIATITGFGPVSNLASDFGFLT